MDLIPFGFFKAGLEKLRQKDAEGALRDFDKALDSGYNDYAVHEMRASALEKLNQPRAALKSVKTAIGLQPNRWELYARAARLFLSLDNQKSALAMLDLAEQRLRNEPEPVDAEAKKKRANARRGVAQLRSQASELSVAATGSMRMKTLRCHIAKLPIEMLESVFSLLIMNEQRYAPLLSHVCHFWRELCISKPSFWYALRVHDAKTTSTKIFAWLERSNGCITHLDLLAGGPISASVLLRQSLGGIEWRHLSRLHITTDNTLWAELRSILASATGCPVGNLEELDISSSTRDHSYISLSCRSDTSHGEDGQDDAFPLTRMSSLTIRQCRLDDSDIVSSCSCITTFRLYGVQWKPKASAFAQFLRNNSTLQTLALETNETIRVPESIGAEEILLPTLAHLSLTMTVPIAELCDLIRAPNLVSLNLSSTSHERILNGIIATMIARGGFSGLEELHIQRSSAIGILATDFLALSPRLRTLQLSRISSGVNKILQWLGKHDDDGQLPCLRLKHVNFSHCPDITTSPLVNLVKTRLAQTHSESKPEPAVPIATLIVDGCPLVEAETVPWFKQRVHTFSCQYMTKKQASYKR